MRGSFAPLCVCCLLLAAALVSDVESKRSSGSGSRKSGSSGGVFSRRKQPTSSPQQNQHKQTNTRNSTGFGGGAGHGGTGSFLDQERHHANTGGIGGAFGNNQPPRNTNPVGFEHFNKPSAPVPPGQPGGLGGAFGGAKVQSPPYPTHNNPGGFGNTPGQHGGFGSNPAGGGSHYQQPGGFGSPGTHNQQPGGFGTPVQQPGGFGSPGTHYNQQPGGLGSPGTHYNQQPGGLHYNQPASNPHYNQPGFGQQGGSHFGQPAYGGGYHPQQNSFGGGYPAGFGGNQPHNNYGGYNQGYNPGGFGGGYPSSYGGGHYGGGGFGSGGYNVPGKSSGPGFGTGLLGGTAAALPLGLLVGYGLGSMGSSSSHSSSPASPAAAASPNNDEAFNAWLKQRTEEEKKKQDAAVAAGAAAGGAAGAATGVAAGGAAAGVGGAAAGVGGAKTILNETEIRNKILSETTMCPGGAGILDASFLNTLVPCNATDVNFNQTDLVEPYEDDCKTILLTLNQINSATNENKTVELKIKQINVTTAPEPGTLAYDLSFDSCLSSVGDTEGRYCVNKGFTVDPYHNINSTLTFLHTANFTLSQFNTTINPNSSCTTAGGCGPDSKVEKNITSTFIKLSLLPLYQTTVLMSQCVIVKQSPCDPASTTPCDQPLKTVKQSIRTNTTLHTTDFASINFVLHGSTDIFQAFQNPPPPPPPQDAPANNPGSTSTLTGSTTKSAGSSI